MRRVSAVLLVLALALSLVVPSSAAPAPAGPLLPSAPPTDGLSLILQGDVNVADHSGPALSRARAWRPGAKLPASAGALDLVGANFPIANYADAVSNNTNLDRPVMAWNSNRKVWLVVWHAYDRIHNYDIYGREVSETGATPNPVFPIVQAAGTQGAPALAYDAANNQYWLAYGDYSTEPYRMFVQRLSSTGQPQGNPIQVSAPGVTALEPRVACSAQRCMVTFVSGPEDASWIDARSLDAAGNLVSGVVRVSPAGVLASYSDLTYNSADNQFLAVWNQQQNGTGWDILGQVLSPDAAPLGGSINVYVGAEDQYDARVAYSSFLGRYCAVWCDFRDGNDWDIYGRVFDHAAVAMGEAFQVYSGTYDDLEPFVTAHGSRDQFMVVLSRDLQAYGVPAIMAVTVSGAGAVGGSVEVRRGDNERWFPQVSHRTGSDDYLVTCMGDELGGEADVFGRRVRYDRTLQGNVILVAAGRKGQEDPGVAYNAKNNRFLGAWQDYHSINAYDIRARPFAPDGTLLAQEVILSQSGRGCFTPVLDSLPGRDDALVAWVSFQTSALQIRGRRISAAGQGVGNEVHISRDVTTNASAGVAIAANPGRNEYLVTWSCYTEGSYNIYAQRLSAEAALLDANLPVCMAQKWQMFPSVAFNPQAKEYLIVWADQRSPGVGYYAQRVSELGALVGGEIKLADAVTVLAGTSVAWNPERQEYLLVYRDNLPDKVIYGRRLNASAQPVGAAFAITQGAWQATYPQLGYDALCHDYLLTWLESHESTDSDVVGGRLGADGVLVGARFDISARTEI